MKRIVVSRYGGPEVLSVVEEDEPSPGPGEVCVRVLAAGVSFTDTLLRAGTYPGGPKPPFTPGYEFAGVVERVGTGCSTLKPGDHVAALVVWGGYAEMVCVRESWAIEVPADIDPAVLVSVIFPYMTAYQLIHRAARARPGETALYHGAAGRVGVALLELAAPAGLQVYGTAATADCELVERLGGIPIDYTTEDFLTRVRASSGGGVDTAFDGIGGSLSFRSYRALRRGGRLVLFGHYSTIAQGRRSWRGLTEFYGSGAAAMLAGLLSPSRRVTTYRIAKLRDRHPDWFHADLSELIRLLREGRIHPEVAERVPLTDGRHAHELLASRASAGKIVLVPQSSGGS
ncbi:zinc-binding dehydrogenase [Nocardia higoensis]|uniref:Zinc-binding dehydrogenase n=1 Tax=Nocardia higoensis TaxID=228599 RepID=A0ABS0D5K4_9NOCA|nr:medium chain dehydrogenase/reductase family protein [Nocardia higoensis]MBF6353736.1 zinc-binding dehydrogenase [Nocardia higoensis]